MVKSCTSYIPSVKQILLSTGHWIQSDWFCHDTNRKSSCKKIYLINKKGCFIKQLQIFIRFMEKCTYLLVLWPCLCFHFLQHLKKKSTRNVLKYSGFLKAVDWVRELPSCTSCTQTQMNTVHSLPTAGINSKYTLYVHTERITKSERPP